MHEAKILSEFPKNAKEKVRVELSNYRGIEVLNVWVFYDPRGDGTQWLPSKKGISMSTKLIPQLKEAIDKAFQSIRASRETNS